MTATPTRMLPGERGWLPRLFPQGIVHQTTVAALVRDGVLARPTQITVETGCSFLSLEGSAGDEGLTSGEVAHLEKWGDLSPQSLRRLAEHLSRNRLIVDHYVENRERYGPTLVFAADIAHAHTLTKAFNDRHVPAQYVAHRTEHDESDQSILERFRTGALEVVVSVVKLTEGYDLPHVRTVFLTRPTGSRVLLAQMIGRAMRGPRAGGTQQAHLVSFRDHWDASINWAEPMDLLDTGVVETPDRDVVDLDRLEIPWRLYEQLARALEGEAGVGGVEVRWPVGWVDLREPSTGEPMPYLVFADQLAAFERLAARGASVPSNSELRRSFGDLPRNSVPSELQLAGILAYWHEVGEAPVVVRFTAFDEIDPHRVAPGLVDKTQREVHEFAAERAEHPLVVQLFGGVDGYREALQAEIDRILSHRAAVDWQPRLRTARPVVGTEKIWNLKVLAKRVKERYDLGHLDVPVEWSADSLTWAWAFYDPSPDRNGRGRIVVNCLLKTDLVRESTIEFLLYHELLHAHLGAHVGHSPGYRRLERRFDGWAEADADLDTLVERLI